MRLTIRFFVLLFAFSGFAVAAAQPDDRLAVDLYLAENDPPPRGRGWRRKSFITSSWKSSAFAHYELLQTEDFELRHEMEQWFMPRRDFFMRLVPQPRVPGYPRQVKV